MAVPIKVGARTTLGHDLLAEVDTLVPERIVRALWESGHLPNYIHAPPVLAGTPFANLEIFTQPPRLELIPDPHGPGIVGIFNQPMIIRNDTIRGEIANTLVIRLPVQVVERDELQFLELVITQAVVENSAFSNAANAVVQAIVAFAAALIGPVRIPITPPALPHVRFFPIFGKLPLALKVYGNIDGRDPGPTDPERVLLTHQPLFDPPPFPELAAVIDGDLFLSQVHTELVTRGLVNGATVVDQINEKILDLEINGEITIDPDLDIPFLEDGFTLPLKVDFSPTLKSIRLTDDVTVQLGTGQIRVASSIKAIVDNGPDVEADFDLRFAFHFADGQLVAQICQADIDVDTTIFQVMLAIVFGPVGALLGIVLDDVVDKAVSEAAEGETFPLDLPTRTVFVHGIAITNNPGVQAPVVLRVDPFRALIRPDAVGASFRFSAEATAGPIPVPAYFIGHRKNKEVHVASCTYAQMMSPNNQALFVRAPEAVEEGYDGCRLCLPQFDGQGGALLTVFFKRPAGFNQKRTTPITVTGRRTTSQPTTLPTTFTAIGKLTSANRDGYWVDGVETGVLAPGTWSITVSDDGFTGTRTADLLGGDDKRNQVFLEYGVDGPPVGPPIGGVRLTFKVTPEQAAQKEISASYTGEYLGQSDGTLATKKWTTFIGGLEMSGHAILHRDAPFLRPGQWKITVVEQGKTQIRTVQVQPNQLTNIVFNRI